MTTFSRSAFWAFFLSVPFFFFFDKTPRKVIVFFTLASLLSFALLSPQWLLRGGIASYGEATISAASDASRMEYMDLAFNMIKAHPWWGVGFDQFPVAAGFWTPGSPGLPLVHNVFLKIGAESGLPALFAFSAFLALLFKNSLKTPWTAYFLAYLFMAMVDFHPFFLPVGRYLLIFAAGYALHRTRTPLLA
jgi:O-antigen ligase